MHGWQRHLVGMFVALYLMVQVAVPTVGLYVAHDSDRGMPFSWQMFSRVSAQSDE